MRGAMMLVPLVLLGACNVVGAKNSENAASGQNGRRDFPVGAFDRVELTGSPDVVVTVGGAPSVRAEGDTGMIDKLDIRSEGGALRIGFKKGSWSFNFKKSSPVTIYVSAPSLRSAELTGSGDMKVDKVQAEDFAGKVTGSGDLDIGAVRARTVRLAVTGSGGIRASGVSEAADYKVTGSGDVYAGGLEVKRATLAVMGSGNLEAKAMESADVSVTGSGDATVTGTARCNVSKAGSGNARCGG